MQKGYWLILKKSTTTHEDNAHEDNTLEDKADKNIEPCKTKEEFFEYAFDEFVQIEGKGLPSKPGEVYADSLGHPTVGVGHLVVHKRDVLGRRTFNKKTKKRKYHRPNPDNVAVYREKFIELPLLDNEGNPISDEEKAEKFDKMITKMKIKRRGLKNSEISALNMGHLDEKGMRQVFAKDVEEATNRAIEDHPDDFWNMPRSAQASLVHMYFWGKGKVAERLEGNEHRSIGEQLPNAVRVGLNPNIAIRRLANEAAKDSAELKKRPMPPIRNYQQQNFAELNVGMER